MRSSYIGIIILFFEIKVASSQQQARGPIDQNPFFPNYYPFGPPRSFHSDGFPGQSNPFPGLFPPRQPPTSGNFPNSLFPAQNGRPPFGNSGATNPSAPIRSFSNPDRSGSSSSGAIPAVVPQSAEQPRAPAGVEAAGGPVLRCYVCSGQYPDRDCELEPDYVDRGPGKMECRRAYCTSHVRYRVKPELIREDQSSGEEVTMRTLTHADFEVESIARECENIDRGNECNRDGDGLGFTCYQTCTEDLCNDQVLAPSREDMVDTAGPTPGLVSSRTTTTTYPTRRTTQRRYTNNRQGSTPKPINRPTQPLTDKNQLPKQKVITKNSQQLPAQRTGTSSPGQQKGAARSNQGQLQGSGASHMHQTVGLSVLMIMLLVPMLG